jgi:hypothetical protein
VGVGIGPPAAAHHPDEADETGRANQKTQHRFFSSSAGDGIAACEARAKRAV